MVAAADKNNDGEIDFSEFKALMKQKKTKDSTEKARILRDMKDELMRYLKIKRTKDDYNKLGGHFKRALER